MNLPPRDWTINGDFIALQPNGVARYAEEVTRALGQLLDEHHPLTRDLNLQIVSPRERTGQDSRIPIKVVPEFRTRLPQVWVQCQLPCHVIGGLLSFCNLAPMVVRKQITCIHDLHPRLMPESYSYLFRAAHRVIQPILGRRVAYVTTVSKLSRDHLCQFNIAKPDRVVVTYNGADHAQSWDAASASLHIDTRRPFVLYLGRTQKYKNLDLVVRLAPILDQAGIDVWIAGDLLAFSELLLTSKNIRLLGRISDNDLARAMDEALCFLFPSRIEGFGLPAIEAMIRGCPVVASHSPCLPEICGDGALYASPDDPESWMAQIARLHDDPTFRRSMIASGRSRATRYSWRAVAERYLRLMAKIDGVAEVPSKAHLSSKCM